ncbi:MAG: UDP-N-acetylglucosamine 1-carboxyvinyltransferase [Thermoanaerobacteraceae bacterium]|nr:UDP-N-acetylglucosamine 1-carboxyvinyltransferase [Thermoanaerobacteraceae bacterium]
MSKYKVSGGKKLSGSIEIGGAKNAALPIIIATLLARGISIIHNCPYLEDVNILIEILKEIGCKIKYENHTLVIDTSDVYSTDLSFGLCEKIRPSILLIGALIANYGIVNITYPGGCEIGPRPIDLHLKGLRALNINIKELHGIINATSSKLNGNEILLDYPSVGATENIMLAACLAEGDTIIRNAAKEPEVIDLQNFLNLMGANISGAGTNYIYIRGTDKLNPAEYSIIPDRVAAGTYMIAAAITGGEIELKNVISEHLQPIIAKLKECGCMITSNGNLFLRAPAKVKALDIIRTLPYPGFPTDLQAPIMALMSIAKGTTIITETVFENRFNHVEELKKMGADIRVDGRIAVVKGVESLCGSNVTAKDLRGGAALVLAGLAAYGETIVDKSEHIDRGYECFDDILRDLGAEIYKI